MFKRKWVYHMWRTSPSTLATAEDIHFSASAWVYGGVKTYVPKMPKVCALCPGPCVGVRARLQLPTLQHITQRLQACGPRRVSTQPWAEDGTLCWARLDLLATHMHVHGRMCARPPARPPACPHNYAPSRYCAREKPTNTEQPKGTAECCASLGRSLGIFSYMTAKILQSVSGFVFPALMLALGLHRVQAPAPKVYRKIFSKDFLKKFPDFFLGFSPQSCFAKFFPINFSRKFFREISSKISLQKFSKNFRNRGKISPNFLTVFSKVLQNSPKISKFSRKFFPKKIDRIF